MSEVLNVPTMAEMMAQGKQPEVLFWVGCAGSFDDRAKKIQTYVADAINSESSLKFSSLSPGKPTMKFERIPASGESARI